eukprot:4924562-Pyramimonas_sp.AAC.1
MANFLESIGCTHPNETTAKQAVAIYVLARADEKDGSKVRDLHGHIKLARQRARLAHHGVVKTYPPSIEEFEQRWPDIFKMAHSTQPRPKGSEINE